MHDAGGDGRWYERRVENARPARWWVQVVVVYGVFLAFRVARSFLEAADAVALGNARRVIRIEQVLGLDHERLLQGIFTFAEPATRMWNVFYGSAHDLVAVAALVLLWRCDRERYRQWRNVAGWMLGVGLVGFFLFPTTPPRLMPETYGFTDTGVEIGGIGPIRGATATAGGNRFAAVPSLHVGRAAWVAAALLPVIQRRRYRRLVVAYPVAMMLATVVTGNHWILDGLAGLAALAVAFALERIRHRRTEPSVPSIRALRTV